MTFICLWYTIDEAQEKVKDSLELLLLERVNIPLIISISMSISILDGKLAIYHVWIVEIVVEICIFANSLIDATIQDGSTRKRSNNKEMKLKKWNKGKWKNKIKRKER